MSTRAEAITAAPQHRTRVGRFNRSSRCRFGRCCCWCSCLVGSSCGRQHRPMEPTSRDTLPRKAVSDEVSSSCTVLSNGAGSSPATNSSGVSSTMGCGASTVARRTSTLRLRTSRPRRRAARWTPTRRKVRRDPRRPALTTLSSTMWSSVRAIPAPASEVVESELGKSYSVGKGGVENIAMAAQVIFFLSPRSKDEVLRPTLRRSSSAWRSSSSVSRLNWGGAPFPALKDVPAGATRDGERHLRLQDRHRAQGAYLAAFVENGSASARRSR